jgi:predicted ATPase
LNGGGCEASTLGLTRADSLYDTQRKLTTGEGKKVLTRLEVDGFKNLIDFSVDLGPFNCIAGPNGVGKSNILDAIRFVSLLAEHTLMEAALLVRGSDPDTSDLRDLFWTDGKSRCESFRIAVEMIVDPYVSDDFGRPAIASSTYLRYEVEVGYEPPTYKGTLGRLVLQAERLDYITEGEAARRLRFRHNARLFRRAVVTNSRRSKAGYISVNKAADGQIEILVHQDGGSSGQPQKAPASTAPRTIVATSNTSATPTILAARREMQSWRFLALEPSAMRGVDRFHSSPYITANGGNLPATLYRLSAGTNGDGPHPEQVYARISSRLAKLAPVVDLKIAVDEVRQLLTLEVKEASGITLPAGSLSDGTLRFLTLCILAEDASATGLVCMEEPENGIHPAKMNAMVELLRELAVDPMQPPGSENPFRQVVVATHSPAFVQLQKRDDLLFAVETKVKGPLGRPTRTIRCRPLMDTWRTDAHDVGIGMATILSYLTTPPGAQLELPVGEAFFQNA